MTSKLIESEKLYNRIKSDSMVDAGQCKIFYFDRVKDSLRGVSFHQWKPIKLGGDIPWSRVYRFTYRDDILWDRTKRIYKPELFTKTKKQVLTSNIPVYHFGILDEKRGKENWIPSGLTPNVLDNDKDITIVSYNCLFDIYLPTLTNFRLRLPALVDRILDKKPEIVCLQEITPQMKKYLMGHPKIKENYYLIGDDCQPYGQIILTTLMPAASNCHSFSLATESNSKKYLVVTFNLQDGNIFHLVNLHLTSDYQSGSIEKRNKQLEMIYTTLHLQEDQPFLLAGDFNSSQDIVAPHPIKLQDWWKVIHPEAPGYTFDCLTNPLAKKTTTHFVQDRLDRMVGYCLNPTSIQVIGEEIIDDKCLSDHFGIMATFNFVPQEKEEKISLMATPSHILPEGVFQITLPLKYWEMCNILRSKYDHAYKYLPPHITVFDSLVAPEYWLGKVKEDFAVISTKYWERIIRLEKLDVFPQSKYFVLVMIPTMESQTWLLEMRREMQKTLGVNIESNFHLTLGKFTTLGEVRKAKDYFENVIKERGGIEFPMQKMTYLDKRGVSFQALDVISSDTYTKEMNYIESVIEFLHTLIDKTVPIQYQVVGSRNYGITHTDYDMVAIHPHFTPEMIELIQTWAQFSGLFLHANLVPSKVPSLNLTFWDGQDVNLVLIRVDKWKDVPKSLEIMLQPFYHRDILLEKHSDLERKRIDSLFGKKYLAIRKWASARKISGAAFGYLPSIAWWTMTWKVFQYAPLESISQFLVRFWKYWDGYDWKIPVMLDNCKYPELQANSCNQWVCIPNWFTGENMVRNVNQYSWDLMVKEITRARELSHSGEWDTLMKKRKLMKPLLEIQTTAVLKCDQATQYRTTLSGWPKILREVGVISDNEWRYQDDHYKLLVELKMLGNATPMLEVASKFRLAANLLT